MKATRVSGSLGIGGVLRARLIYYLRLASAPSRRGQLLLLSAQRIRRVRCATADKKSPGEGALLIGPQ